MIKYIQYILHFTPLNQEIAGLQTGQCCDAKLFNDSSVFWDARGLAQLIKQF